MRTSSSAAPRHDSLRTTALGALTLACAGLGTAAHAQDTCTALKSVALTGIAVEITGSEKLAAGNSPPQPGASSPGYTGALPARCRVEGVIEKRKGVGGVDYGIKFALALPDDWNGRFLFQGGGGLNGNVQPPLGAGAAGGTPGLARNFAVVTTDTGHQGAGFDGSFFADQEATLNFLWLANGKVTLVAKALIES
jgi:hypothetical protein